MAVGLAIIGVVSNRAPTLFISAVVSAPFSLYLGGTPRFGIVGCMIPLLLAGAGFAVRSGHARAAWSMVIPVLVVMVWVAGVVVRDV